MNDWVQTLKYDWNQLNTVSTTEKQFYKTGKSIEWSTVSNAALRSSNTSNETWPLSVRTLNILLYGRVQGEKTIWKTKEKVAGGW